MPLHQAHTNITLVAIDSICSPFSNELVKGILKGVIDPDRVPDITLKTKLYITRRGGLKIKTIEGYASHHKPSKDIIGYYYDLSLYYLRQGVIYRAGFMFGRALHYIQDGSLERKRHLILDVHNTEEPILNKLAVSPRHVEKICKTMNVVKKRSSKATEALCIAFKESKLALSQFIEELSKDVERLKERIKVVKLAKVLVAIIAICLSIAIQYLLFLTPLAIIAIYIYRPKIYYEAMRTGIIKLKSFSVSPAYQSKSSASRRLLDKRIREEMLSSSIASPAFLHPI